MTILEEFQGGKKKAPNGIRSGVFAIAQVMTEFSLQTCSRKRADVPDVAWTSHKLKDICNRDIDAVMLSNLNLVISPNDEFKPEPRRTVITGQAVLTFMTFLAGELYKILEPSDILADDEKEELTWLKYILTLADGEKRIFFTNDAVDNLMGKYIDSVLSGEEFIIPESPSKDEKAILDCYKAVHYFFQGEDAEDLAYDGLKGLFLGKIIISVSQIANEVLGESMVAGFANWNEAN